MDSKVVHCVLLHNWNSKQNGTEIERNTKIHRKTENISKSNRARADESKLIGRKTMVTLIQINRFE